MRKPVRLMIVVAALAAAPSQAAYPDRPIRLIVPYAPGGNIDITARTIAPALGEALAVQIVVDNRGGAGGTLGSEIAAKSPPDGYTLLMGSSGTLATARALYPRLNFDPLKDFAYTSLVSVVPLVAEVSPSLPVKNVKDLIDLAKSRPGRVHHGLCRRGNIQSSDRRALPVDDPD